MWRRNSNTGRPPVLQTASQGSGISTEVKKKQNKLICIDFIVLLITDTLLKHSSSIQRGRNSMNWASRLYEPPCCFHPPRNFHQQKKHRYSFQKERASTSTGSVSAVRWRVGSMRAPDNTDAPSLATWMQISSESEAARYIKLHLIHECCVPGSEVEWPGGVTTQPCRLEEASVRLRRLLRPSRRAAAVTVRINNVSGLVDGLIGR